MDDLQNKEDGLQLLIEPGYKLCDVLSYLRTSCLAARCSSILEQTECNVDSTELCKQIVNLLNEDLSLEELTDIMIASCMCFYVEPDDDLRHYTINKAFRYSDTLHPMHLHYICKKLWKTLKQDGSTKYVLNIIYLCRQIALTGETGNAIVLCLMWAIICEITDTEIEMFCFRKLSELNEMLKNIDVEVLKQEESVQSVHILIQAICIIVNCIVFRNNKDLKEAGYGLYLNYTKRDLENLKNWTEAIANSMNVSVSKTKNFWELTMIIQEEMNCNIVGLLHDRIVEM